jgi:hypothetical protein
LVLLCLDWARVVLIIVYYWRRYGKNERYKGRDRVRNRSVVCMAACGRVSITRTLGGGKCRL